MSGALSLFPPGGGRCGRLERPHPIISRALSFLPLPSLLPTTKVSVCGEESLHRQPHASCYCYFIFFFFCKMNYYCTEM